MKATAFVLESSALALLLLASFGIVSASAQDRPGDFGFRHHANHDWYRDLHQPVTGYSCCNGQSADDPNGDCRPTRAVLMPDGHWRAIVDGEWRDIPPEVVLKNLGAQDKDPIHAHVCAGRSGTIYCFIGAGDGS
jgi:hypothetical protein